MPVRSTVLRISLLALLVALVASTPLVHGKPTESSQGAVDSLSRRVDELSTRQKMWEEVQDRSRSEWIAVQKELQAAHQESAKQNQSAAVKEVKDLIAEFKDGYDSKIEMVDKWVTTTTASMGILVGMLGLIATIAGIGGYVGYKRNMESIEGKARKSLQKIEAETSNMQRKIATAYEDAFEKLKGISECHESAKKIVEETQKNCSLFFRPAEYETGSGVLDSGPAQVEGEDVLGDPDGRQGADCSSDDGSMIESVANIKSCSVSSLKVKLHEAIRQNDSKKAEITLMRLVDLDPSNVDYVMAHGIFCGKIGQETEFVEDAIAWTKKAEDDFKRVAYEHNDPIAWANYGSASLNIALKYKDVPALKAKVIEAIDALKRAETIKDASIFVKSKLAVAYCLLAENTTKREQIVEFAQSAIACAEAVLSVDGQDQTALYAYSVAQNFLVYNYYLNSNEGRSVAKKSSLRVLDLYKKLYPWALVTAQIQYEVLSLSDDLNERLAHYAGIVTILSRIPYAEKCEKSYDLEVGCLLRRVEDLQDETDRVNMLQAASQILSERKERYPKSLFYNDACLESRLGNQATAIQILEDLLKQSRLPSHLEMLEDRDLKGLREMSEFRSIIERRKAEEE